MTCDNAELRLEIGNGKYFPVLGNPEIDDNLTSHGAECSLTIRVTSNAILPSEGAIAFLTRNINSNREKVFGGICGAVPVKLGIASDNISLKLNSYIKYCNYGNITNYRRTDILEGHIEEAARQAGAMGVDGIPRQLVQTFVNADPNNNDSFYWEFAQGKLQAFLDDICKKKNYSWKLQDTGALTIALLGTYNARLLVISNAYLNNPAPKPILTIPESGDPICSDTNWWTPGLTYQVIPPQGSVFRGFGRNGKRYFTDYLDKGKSINPDTKRYRGEADRDSYPIPNTADEILTIRITT